MSFDPNASAEMQITLPELLKKMTDAGGSDLHLTTNSAPQVRVHGHLSPLAGFGPLTPADTKRLAYSVLTDAQKHRFEENLELDFSFGLKGMSRFRANLFNQKGAVGAVFRSIPYEIKSFEALGLPQVVQDLCKKPRGLVLVTGPTGSGKSTTLASMVDKINIDRHDHILTIEDPIEFVHSPQKCVVTQRQVGFHTKSFKQALRAALREDPDVIMVGEMRDLETVSIAIETAETGHLVLGTLHTTTAASTVDRIIDQFPADRQSQIRVMLSESLKGVIAQVLCPKVGGGRVAAKEVLLSIPAIANLIREGKTFQIPSIMQTNRKVGMVTLNDALLDLVEAGQIEPREAWLKAAEKTGILASLKARGHKTDFAAEA